MDKKDLFRKKNLEKASELDQQSRYLKVTGFSAWLIVIAAAIVVIGIFLWAGIAKISDLVRGAAKCEGGALTCYFRQEDVQYMGRGTIILAEGNKYTVDEVLPELIYINDIPMEILDLSRNTQWYQTVTAKCDLDDGIYQVCADLSTITPISYMSERN